MCIVLSHQICYEAVDKLIIKTKQNKKAVPAHLSDHTLMVLAAPLVAVSPVTTKAWTLAQVGTSFVGL